MPTWRVRRPLTSPSAPRVEAVHNVVGGRPILSPSAPRVNGASRRGMAPASYRWVTWATPFPAGEELFFVQGVIKSYDPGSGDGVVLCDTDLAEYELDSEALLDSVFRMLRQGQRVIFDVTPDGL